VVFIIKQKPEVIQKHGGSGRLPFFIYIYIYIYIKKREREREREEKKRQLSVSVCFVYNCVKRVI
jgi:hypothetical protein